MEGKKRRNTAQYHGLLRVVVFLLPKVGIVNLLQVVKRPTQCLRQSHEKTTTYEHFGNPSGLYWKTNTFDGKAVDGYVGSGSAPLCLSGIKAEGIR